MPTTLAALAAHLDDLLAVDRYDDYAPNGLQVEGRAEVSRVVCGVSANQALIDAAVDRGADAVVVHHGFFWRTEPRTLVGLRARRVGALLRAGISLLAYHLPLDGHPALGNAAGVLGVVGAEPTEPLGAPPVGWLGPLPAPLAATQVLADLARGCGQEATAFLFGPREVTRVAVVTGGGPGYLEQAVAAGADLFVTGEVSEQSQGLAAELGANFAAFGHHATERFGPRMLADHLAATFALDAPFIDVANPA